MQELLDRASLVPVKEGGANVGRDWICPDCGTRNPPLDSLLLKLHPLGCSNVNKKCYTRNPVGYGWSIVTSVLNKVKLDMLIRNQGDYGTCTAHTVIEAMDLARRISGALHKFNLTHPLDVLDLVRKYFAIYSEVLGQEITALLISNRLLTLFSIAQTQGVRFMMPPIQIPQIPAATPYEIRIKSVFQVPKSEIDHAVHLVAGGYPLVTGVPTGRCFVYLTSGQIYDTPEGIDPTHAVLVIGFGVANWPGEDKSNSALASWPQDMDGNRLPRVFYRCRNSWGDQSHANHALAGKGADFDVWADEVGDFLYGFHLM